MHGKVPSCGFWRPSGAVGGHLLLNVSAADYLDPPAGSNVFMPVTIIFGFSLDRFAMRSTFATSAQTAQAKAPRPVSPLPSNVDGDVWLPWEANNFGQWVREKTQSADGSRDGPVMEFADFFQTLFGRPPPPVLQVAQGAQFTASRAVLRREPLATYRWLLGRLEQGHVEVPYTTSSSSGSTCSSPPSSMSRRRQCRGQTASRSCCPFCTTSTATPPAGVHHTSRTGRTIPASPRAIRRKLARESG